MYTVLTCCPLTPLTKSVFKEKACHFLDGLILYVNTWKFANIHKLTSTHLHVDNAYYEITTISMTELKHLTFKNMEWGFVWAKIQLE